MDATHGITAPALSSLGRSIREYSLFQGVMLVLSRLRKAHPDLNDEALYERLEFRANPSLGFPGSDIERVEFFHEHGELRARMCLNLIGLSGSSSPLPAFYSEQALGDNMGDNPTRDFLDLFSDRLQRLMLPIWRKYRYHCRYQPGATDDVSTQMFALIGLGHPALRQGQDLNWKRLLPYLGLLSMRTQSAALLEAVLRYYFQHTRMRIEECIERSVDIDPEQQNRLGLANNQLGTSLVLGDRIRDRSGKFRLHIGDLDWDGFHDYLPTGKAHTPLLTLMRFCLRTPLAYDIRLHLRRDAIQPLHLANDNRCRLGWTSWIGQVNSDPEVTLAAGTKD